MAAARLHAPTGGSPSGSLRLWLAVAVIATAARTFPGKYADAENNESTSFLPGDAESTKALAITEELEGGEQARSSSSTGARAG